VLKLNSPQFTDRSGSFPVITYLTNDSSVLMTQNCSKLVLAFPPVMHALQAANLNLTHDEVTVFSPVGITKYWSGAVRVATPDGFTFAGFLRETFVGLLAQLLGGVNIPFIEFIPWLPEPAGQPVAFLRLENASDIATTYSWGKYRSNQTLASAKALLKQTLSKINKDPRNVTALPVPITDDDIKDFREWDYFPHYDQRQLDQGYYSKFNNLQGNNNTYYASGLNGFETVEFAIRAGIDIVDTYFNPTNTSASASASASAETAAATASSGATGSSRGGGVLVAVAFASVVGLCQLVIS
jgi:hypothetical protein